jgi:DNA-binding NtrC family response regulator
MQRVYTQIAWAAHSGAPALITGQAGTGKDLAARSIHVRGSLQSRRFRVRILAATNRDLAAAVNDACVVALACL